ncbi:MAG: Holliday junction resolvase RuvX [Parcubacteria group bacterium]|nr:Holliday junction resolvase RuvX [Parcubacteria group bacterium]
MNYLGIDYGEAKIGLAKASDELRIATPFRTVLNDADVVDQLERIILTEGIEYLVVGYPLTMTGGAGASAESVDRFIEKLKTLSLPIAKQDERFSTKSAVSSRGNDHASAAALILQAYLDSHQAK